MRINRVYFGGLLTLSAAALYAGAGCNGVECGKGTIDRNGTCVPADETVSDAKCGAFTKLVGNVCVPMFPPTVCDDQTTDPDVDTATGVTTCIGNGKAACGVPIACPPPATGKQTICGQIFNFETNAVFSATNAMGTRCTAGATAGPCALGIRAFDAVQFGTNPSTAQPLAVGDTYIDDCGRYRLTDITVPANPFIGLGIDDANMANQGPLGITNTIGVATAKAPDTATRDLEAFVAPKSTTDQWMASGGPAINGGIFAMVFRTGKAGTQNKAGVTRSGPAGATVNYYFQAAQTTRATVDAAATVTGANGTVLVTGAKLSDGFTYSGSGGLPPECKYSSHAGIALPFILFIQVARPIDNNGMTCPL